MRTASASGEPLKPTQQKPGVATHAMSISEIGTDEDRFEEYVKAASRGLPIMPHIAAAVAKLASDPKTSLDELRNLVDRDPALTARMLKMSNSPLHGFPHEVQGLGVAFTLLGREAVRNMVLAMSMQHVYTRFGLMERLLWQHATLAGPVAGRLAEHPGIKINAREAFTAGMLHDVGKTALANSYPDQYEAVMMRVYNETTSFVKVEREHFGFDHAELGARVAEEWGVPANIVSVIRHHHDPAALESLPEDVARLTALTSVATACLTRLGIGRREPVPSLDIAALPSWRFLGLDAAEVDRVLLVCRQELETNRGLLG
jgi:putative nucleotidyltransferase with HDIG domain